MINLEELAKAFAESNTKTELEFCLVELIKRYVPEDKFWEMVENYRERLEKKYEF